MKSNRHTSYHKNMFFNRKNNNTYVENKFRFELASCSKHKDLAGAISLYESAASRNVRLTSDHFNTLLYVCSVSATDLVTKDSAINHGFRIFDHMISSNITPNEATITALARLAAAKGDGDHAFDLIKDMGKYGATPKLRSYDPVLSFFCGALEADKAYAVEVHMDSMGVSMDEPQIAALFKVSAETGLGDKVYEYFHKLRNTVRCISEFTAEVIENWFRNPVALEVGSSDYDMGEIKERMLKNGGGWHGKGWLGKGEWIVCRSNVESHGRCSCCSEQLACVDIDKAETGMFADSIATLALERESKENFKMFIDWLDSHAKFEAVVDGANIALYQQNFADSAFSISQLEAVVTELHKSSKNKWPLVILHNKRVRALMDDPNGRQLLEKWKSCGGLYTTPSGSNDDWYWLYAAIKLKCLLVTNDEMRDHIFELVGSKFILRWKERHQVRYTFTKGHVKLRMPPPYSVVIQESEKGNWHVPIAGEGDDDTSTTWICITRPTTHVQLDKAAMKNSNKVLVSCNLASNGASDSFGSPQNVDNRSTKVSGKRKERS